MQNSFVYLRVRWFRERRVTTKDTKVHEGNL